MQTAVDIEVDMQQAQEVWNKIQNGLQGTMTKQTFDHLYSGSQATEIRPPAEGDTVPTLVVELATANSVEWATATMQEKTEHFIERYLGYPLHIQYEARNHNAQTDDPEIHTELSDYNPQDSGFIVVSNYVSRYWQAYLGRGPFALWIVIRGYAWAAQKSGEWPTIGVLADILGVDRHTITGRSRNGEWQDGYINVLENEGIMVAKYRTNGYTYVVRDTLPLLTPIQATKMTQRMQAKHEAWLVQNHVNLEMWRRIAVQTIIQ